MCPKLAYLNQVASPLNFKVEKSEMGTKSSKGSDGFSASQRDLHSIIGHHFRNQIATISAIVVLACLVSCCLYIKNRKRSIMNTGRPNWDPEKLENSPYSGDWAILALVNKIGSNSDREWESPIVASGRRGFSLGLENSKMETSPRIDTLWRRWNGETLPTLRPLFGRFHDPFYVWVGMLIF